MSGRWNRRRVLTGTAAVVGAAWLGRHGAQAPLVRPAFAEPTPACGDGDPTRPLTEGPFYSPDSPEKVDLREDGDGEPVTLAGAVVDTRCRALADAVVDLWHADDGGRYDNRGDRFRGHQRTGADGRYRFETIRPGRYAGRTRHYHLKVAAPGRAVLTTQLYFPGEPANESDWLFRESLLVAMDASGPVPVARFTFVLPEP